jgi:hypothetical protein
MRDPRQKHKALLEKSGALGQAVRACAVAIGAGVQRWFASNPGILGIRGAVVVSTLWHLHL